MKKLKAVTFSFDDGVAQDKRLIEIFDRYNLKCTFNINSGWFGKRFLHQAMLFGKMTQFDIHRLPENEIAGVYKNHEVAAHSVSHPMLTELPDNEVIAELRNDATALEKPAMALVYDPKISAFMESLSQPDCVNVESMDFDKAKNIIEQVIEQKDERQLLLHETNALMRRKAEENARLAIDLLER